MRGRIVLLVLFLFGMSSIAFAQGEVAYQVDGMDDVTVTNVEYRVVDDVSFTMDIYYPPDIADEAQLPVVIFANGFRDSKISQFIGSGLKDAPPYTSWGRLVAAHGLVGIN